jgi:opacity protein-like surface antigen
MKKLKLLIAFIASLVPLTYPKAEPYVSASLGWTFNSKLSGIKGNENLDYPDPIGTNPGLYFPGTSYSDIKLKDVLQGGIKAGYYFESMPNFGLEIEGNYSQPNMKRQNVTIFNSNGIGDIVSIGATGSPGATASPNQFTEDQLPAKVQLFQINFNGLYRYQGFKDFTPYIGGGPSVNIIRITGTGYSGILVDPPTGDSGTGCLGSTTVCSRVNDTSVNVGANFKLGAEYHLDKDWGLGAEYHYNWVPVNISNFRSSSNLNADLNMQSLSFVLTRHF